MKKVVMLMFATVMIVVMTFTIAACDNGDVAQEALQAPAPVATPEATPTPTPTPTPEPEPEMIRVMFDYWSFYAYDDWSYTQLDDGTVGIHIDDGNATITIRPPFSGTLEMGWLIMSDVLDELYGTENFQNWTPHVLQDLHERYRAEGVAYVSKLDDGVRQLIFAVLADERDSASTIIMPTVTVLARVHCDDFDVDVIYRVIASIEFAEQDYEPEPKSVEIVLSELGIDNAQLAAMVESGEIPTDVTILDLRSNEISDITPLAGLTNLTVLDLRSNEISDITPLAGLTNLTVLDLRWNEISDIAQLAGLSNLTNLYLLSNEISDITPLAGLTNLTTLLLQNNQISDITPLAELMNLTRVGLTDNQITDWTSVAHVEEVHGRP